LQISGGIRGFVGAFVRGALATAQEQLRDLFDQDQTACEEQADEPLTARE
jgi:hypothetical protein